MRHSQGLWPGAPPEGNARAGGGPALERLDGERMVWLIVIKLSERQNFLGVLDRLF